MECNELIYYDIYFMLQISQLLPFSLFFLSLRHYTNRLNDNNVIIHNTHVEKNGRHFNIYTL